MDQLFPIVYERLHALAAQRLRQDGAGHAVSPTTLVHEAYLRLADDSRLSWGDRTHFFALAATAIRRILVDHARRRGAAKRGGDWQQVRLETVVPECESRQTTVMALNEALDKLARLNARQARIIELRFFGGLSI